MNTKNITPFSDEEILIFFNLIFYVEKEIKSKNSKGYYIQDNNFQKFCTTHNITIVETDTKTLKQKITSTGNNIYFTNTQSNQIASMFVHFRNAICHLQIEDRNGHYLLKDMYNNKATMTASIEKELFVEFIEAMKVTRK